MIQENIRLCKKEKKSILIKIPDHWDKLNEDEELEKRLILSENNIGESIKMLQVEISDCFESIFKACLIQKKMEKGLEVDAIKRKRLSDKFELWRTSLKCPEMNNNLLVRKSFHGIKRSFQAKGLFLKNRLSFYENSDLERLKKRKEELISNVNSLSESNNKVKEEVRVLKGIFIERKKGNILKHKMNKTVNYNTQSDILINIRDKYDEEKDKRENDQSNLEFSNLNLERSLDFYFEKYHAYQKHLIQAQSKLSTYRLHQPFSQTHYLSAEPQLSVNAQADNARRKTEVTHKESIDTDSDESLKEDDIDLNNLNLPIQLKYQDKTEARIQFEDILSSKFIKCSNKSRKSSELSEELGIIDLNIHLLNSSKAAKIRQFNYLRSCYMAERTLLKFKNYSVAHHCKKLKKEFKKIFIKNKKIEKVRKLKNDIEDIKHQENKKCQTKMSNYTNNLLNFEKYMEEQKCKVNDYKCMLSNVLVKVGLQKEEDRNMVFSCWKGGILDGRRGSKYLGTLLGRIDACYELETALYYMHTVLEESKEKYNGVVGA